MKLLINPSLDPAYNLALEELLAGDSNDEVLMLWRNAPAIIVGCNQNTEAEINAEAVRKLGIQVVRRITGGGAVYHDPGNINYTIATNGRQLDPEAFARNAEVMIRVLRKLNIPAEFSGRNDILVEGRKISGSAKSVLRSRTLFHGTLLFDAELNVLGSVLTPDEEKIRAKGIKSVRSRVANLKEYMPGLEVDDFMDQLTAGLLEELNVPAVSCIPAGLSAGAVKLAVEKYRTWQWNFGSRTSYKYSQKKRFASGCVEVSFNVVDNRIVDLGFSGDFFGNRPVAELAAVLNGTEPRFSAIAEKISSVDVETFIAGISKEELLSLFRLG